MKETQDMRPYLAPNFFVDSDHAAVIGFTEQHRGSGTLREQAIRLYYAVRDGWRYNPWRVILRPEAFKASELVNRDPAEGAHCIDKANLLAAAARICGIPSRLHFANVRNHIGTEKLEKLLQTDLLVYHGYAGLFIEDRWVAATPAFNRELCEHLDVEPLEFDGRSDSIFQQYNRSGGRFMEYVTDHGHSSEIPFDDMVAAWKEHYPEVRKLGAWPWTA